MDPEEKKKLIVSAHEGLGDSIESKSLGGHVGRDKTTWKIIDAQFW